MLYLCHGNVVPGPDAVARGDHVSVYHQLLQGPAPHEDLRLLIGQSNAIVSIEDDFIGQQSTVGQQLDQSEGRIYIFRRTVLFMAAIGYRLKARLTPRKNASLMARLKARLTARLTSRLTSSLMARLTAMHFG